jgi:GNAT superfamily N-acetyltransferase
MSRGKKIARSRFRVLPLTPERWEDFVTLFGPRGACGGCWCMTPRLTRSEYERRKGAGNRRAMKRLVSSGNPPGVLGYVDGEPAAWCSLEPREAFSSLTRSRILKPVDDKPVWSIVCLFIAREHREKGVSVALIQGAVEWARSNGARIIEAYPVEPRKKPMPPVFAYTGIASAFRTAGFREVARRSETRPIMRRAVRPGA